MLPSGSGWFLAQLDIRAASLPTKFRVGLGLAEVGRWRGGGEIEFGHRFEGRDGEAGDLGSDRHVVDEVEVLDRHLASRSSGSRSCSMI